MGKYDKLRVNSIARKGSTRQALSAIEQATSQASLAKDASETARIVNNLHDLFINSTREFGKGGIVLDGYKRYSNEADQNWSAERGHRPADTGLSGRNIYTYEAQGDTVYNDPDFDTLHTVFWTEASNKKRRPRTIYETVQALKSYLESLINDNLVLIEAATAATEIDFPSEYTKNYVGRIAFDASEDILGNIGSMVDKILQNQYSLEQLKLDVYGGSYYYATHRTGDPAAALRACTLEQRVADLITLHGGDECADGIDHDFATVEIQDEGVPLTTAVTKINFAGSGIVATEPVVDEILVTVDAGGAGYIYNHFINPNFSTWQRGIPLSGFVTASTMYTADRWEIDGDGGTVEAYHVETTPGSIVDASGDLILAQQNHIRLHRPGAGNSATLGQKVEDVRKLMGTGFGKLNLMLVARASTDMGGAATAQCVPFAHMDFASADPDIIGSISTSLWELTTDWQVFTLEDIDLSQPVAAPFFAWPGVSLSGLAVPGSDSYLGIGFVFIPGAAITVDIAFAGIGFADGPVEGFIKRSEQEELALCMRYFEKSFASNQEPEQNVGTETGATIDYHGGFTGLKGVNVQFTVPKRTDAYTFTTYNPFAANSAWRNAKGAHDLAVSVGTQTRKGVPVFHDPDPNGAAGDRLLIHWTAEDEL
tara:strand:- start:55811 stop:57769 length:1959 start_codon:yes stop_codon:yes gene_type:complete